MVTNLSIISATSYSSANSATVFRLTFNMRDTANLSELAVLANMEALNSELLKQGYTDLQERKVILHKAAKEQLAKFKTMGLDAKFAKIDHLGNPKYLK